MPNQVAGEFDAVLQLSGRVLDRLMASLHQNEALKQGLTLPGAGEAIGQALARNLPSFPHSVYLRIGDPLPMNTPLLILRIGQPTDLQPAAEYDVSTPLPSGATPAYTGTLQPAARPGSAPDTGMAAALDGVRGSVRAQLGVPRIELKNAARQFIIEVPVRARYTRDVDTTMLPEFIHGVMRAEYSVREIVLAGGKKRLLRFAVLPAQVSFQSYSGITSDDARIARQIARVLQTRFLASDQELGFPLRTIKSIVAGGFSALTAGFSISGEEPAGSMATYSTMLLHGHDFAVGISAAYLETQAANAAARPELTSFSVSNKTDVLFAGTVVDVTVKFHSIWATYTGKGHEGFITINVAFLVNGRIPGYRFNNYVFTVSQMLRITFDSTTGALMIEKQGGLNLPFLLRLAANATGMLGKLNAQVDAGIAIARAGVGKLSQLTSRLNALLRKLDAQPTSRVTAAAFEPDGIVLRGRISLAERWRPIVEFNKLGTLDGYSACPSWLPGGTVDSFHWRWSWFYPTQSAMINLPVQASSTATYLNRFVLRDEDHPLLPGIHGGPATLMTGALCLSIRGKQIDAQSGDPVQVDSSQILLPQPVCQFFSPQLQVDVAPGLGRLLSKLQQKKPLQPKTVWPEVALIDIGGGTSAHAGHSTLVCYLHEPPRPGDLRTIGQAIEQAERNDAGLLVAIVLSEGINISEGEQELQQAIGAIRAPVLVTEDVQRGWSKAFDLSGDRRGLKLRLVAPGGRVVWASDQPLEARELADALREHLAVGGFAALQAMPSALQAGMEAPATLLELAPSEAISLRSLRGAPVIMCFVRADSESSDAQLQQLDRQEDAFVRSSAQVIAVVDQADARVAHALKHRLALNYHVSSDPDGSITRSWGVRLWPTTVFIDEHGLIEGVRLGIDTEIPTSQRPTSAY